MVYSGYIPSQVELKACHICSTDLLPNPLYDEAVSKYCPHHGDFFVVRLRGQDPSVVFRPFELKRAPNVAAAGHHKRYVPMPKPHGKPGHPGVNVRCDQTGDIFATIKEAAKVMGLDQTSIIRSMQGKQRSVAGYTFTRMVDVQGRTPAPFVPKPRLPIIRVNSWEEKRPIRCDQTGQIFESVYDAARVLGLRRANISKQINGHQKVVQGYTFTKIERGSHETPEDGSVPPAP